MERIRKIILLSALLGLFSTARGDIQIISLDDGAPIASSGALYPTVIAYHNCDAKGDLIKTGGTGTVTYTAGWDLATANGHGVILGADSWDSDNDGFEYARINTSGNTDFTGGRIGNYFCPDELAAGNIIFTSTVTDASSGLKGLRVQWLTPDELRVTCKGTTGDTTNANLSAGTTYFFEYAFTQPGGNQKVELFIDGVSKVSVTGTGLLSDTYLFFGTFDGNQWDGRWDQFISCNDETTDINAIKNVTSFP
jgi:hypothetical protein